MQMEVSKSFKFSVIHQEVDSGNEILNLPFSALESITPYSFSPHPAGATEGSLGKAELFSICPSGSGDGAELWQRRPSQGELLPVQEQQPLIWSLKFKYLIS